MKYWNVATCNKGWFSTRWVKERSEMVRQFLLFRQLWNMFILGGYIWSSWMCIKWDFPGWWMFELCDCTIPPKYLHCGLWLETIPTCRSILSKGFRVQTYIDSVRFYKIEPLVLTLKFTSLIYISNHMAVKISFSD